MIDKGVDHLDRLVEKAAGIVAEIDDVALELVGRNILLELQHRRFQSVGRLFVELRDADVADVLVLLMRLHGFDVDFRARELDVDLLLVLAAKDRQLDRRVDDAAHFLDGLIERQALHAFVVDAGDQVAGLDAGARGRRVVDRGHHLDEAIFLRDLDPQTAELALGLGPHILESLGVEIARMRIERRQHAVDRGFDHLLFVWLLDIVGAHLVEDVAEQAQILICVGRSGQRGPADQTARLLTERHTSGAQGDAGSNQSSFPNHPPTFRVSDRAHHGPGSIEVPSLRNSTYKTGCFAPIAMVAAVCAVPSPMLATGSPANRN